MSRFSDLIGGKQPAPAPEVLAEVMPTPVVEEAAPEPELLVEQEPQTTSRRKKKRKSSGF